MRNPDNLVDTIQIHFPNCVVAKTENERLGSIYSQSAV